MKLAAVLVALLFGCQGYQVEPYAELQTRDEGFTPEGGASTYSGETYLVGVRYVPPVRIEDFQLERVVAAMRGQPAPVNASPGTDGGRAAELEKVGAWPWYTWVGLAGVLIAAGFAAWAARAWASRRSSPSQSTRSERG